MWPLFGNSLKQIFFKVVELCNNHKVLNSKHDAKNSLLCKLMPMNEDFALGRGYYNGPAYPHFGYGFDPLVLLVGLAFLALLLQTFFSLSRGPSPLPVNATSRTGETYLTQLADIVSNALKKYENLSIKEAATENKNRESSWITMVLPTFESFIKGSPPT